MACCTTRPGARASWKHPSLAILGATNEWVQLVLPILTTASLHVLGAILRETDDSTQPHPPHPQQHKTNHISNSRPRGGLSPRKVLPNRNFIGPKIGQSVLVEKGTKEEGGDHMDCLEMVHAGSTRVFLSVQQCSLLDKLDPCSATSLPLEITALAPLNFTPVDYLQTVHSLMID